MARQHLDAEEVDLSPCVCVKWSLAILLGLILGATGGFVLALYLGLIEFTC